VTEGDGHSGIGRTLYDWDPDVDRVRHLILKRFPTVSVNTYRCHPYCGWERRSLDVWDQGGRGAPLRPLLSRHVLDYLLELPGKPLIRHWILEHDLWVRGKGFFPWPADDHTGALRHVHVTYLPVPDLR
jgi:hypothetical protein